MDQQYNEIEYKAYNPEIMRRLMEYAKPYKYYIGFSILLLLLATGVQIVQPLILGEAIDQITGNKTYEIAIDGDIEIRGYTLKYIDDLNILTGKESLAQLINIDKKYYLVTELSIEDLKLLESFNEEETHFIIDDSTLSFNGNSYEAYKLSNQEIINCRSANINELKRLTLIFLILLVIGMVTTYYEAIILQYAGQKIIYNIRNKIFKHVESLSINYFNNHPVGTIVTRVTNDTETLNEMYTSVISNFIKNIFVLIGIVIMMFSLNVLLSCIVLTIIPVIIIATAIYRKYSKENYRIVRTRLAKINAFLSEHIQGMKIIQIFSQEEKVYKEFKQYNMELRQSNIKEILMFGIYKPFMYAMYVIGICLVLGFGGGMLLKGVITLGTLVVFFQYIHFFFQPIQELAEQFNILQSAMASAEKIFKVIDTKDHIANKENAKEIKEVIGKIEFKNVWFAYEKEDWVLRDVSFTVNPGDSVAFVGATGAGKTSILNLISRYYDIQKGEILIDSVNIKEYDLHSLRRHIGQMLQDVFLFTGDIKSNIGLNNQDISKDDIIKAAKYVNAHQFISQLPGQYDEKVYERGATLSAGQRQLLSFARTLVYNPSILILDEATANIDTETEQLIQDALEKIMKGRTTLIVAHRLSTVQHADKIIVMHKGKVREMGNHQELLSNKGIYYRLYELQYKDQA